MRRHLGAGVVLLLAAMGVLSGAVSAVRPAEPVQVTVVDHTGGRWQGLQAAVEGWNQSPHVHLTLAHSCTPGRYCAVVDAYDQGATWAGLTTYLTRSMAHVQLDTTALAGYSTVAEQTSVVAHELGHVLGLQHRDTTEPTVMCEAGEGPNVATLPTAADLRQLAVIARHGADAGAFEHHRKVA